MGDAVPPIPAPGRAAFPLALASDLHNLYINLQQKRGGLGRDSGCFFGDVVLDVAAFSCWSFARVCV